MTPHLHVPLGTLSDQPGVWRSWDAERWPVLIVDGTSKERKATFALVRKWAELQSVGVVETSASDRNCLERVNLSPTIPTVVIVTMIDPLQGASYNLLGNIVNGDLFPNVCFVLGSKRGFQTRTPATLLHAVRGDGLIEVFDTLGQRLWTLDPPV